MGKTTDFDKRPYLVLITLFIGTKTTSVNSCIGIKNYLQFPAAEISVHKKLHSALSSKVQLLKKILLISFDLPVKWTQTRCMNSSDRFDTVSFTTKGQIVIPSWLRKEFDIQEGSKAVVTSTPSGILLRPVTAPLIRRGRGIIKHKAGDKPLSEMCQEHQSTERNAEGN